MSATATAERVTLYEAAATTVVLTTVGQLREFAAAIVAEHERTRQRLEEERKATREQELVPRKEALARLGVHSKTLWSWQKSGYVSPVRVGYKVFFRSSDLDRIDKMTSAELAAMTRQARLQEQQHQEQPHNPHTYHNRRK